MRYTNYQIKTVIYPDDDEETFTYDAMGNRLTRVFNGSTTNYTYNAGERMTAAGGVTYVYDDNGNLTDRGASDDFVWDHENHLASTDIDSVDSTYEYNGDGLRMSRTIGGTTVDYVWDLSGGLPNVLEDSQGNRYVYGLGRIARINGSTEEYYVADGLGSTTALTDDTGSVTVEYAYDAFGNYRPGQGSSTNEFTYTGEQVDETGLQYLRARYYDPEVGRFLSKDSAPILSLNPQALNSYTYVANNPTLFVDRSGLWCPRNPDDCVPDVVEEAVQDLADSVGDAVGVVGDVAEAFATGYVDIGVTGCLPTRAFYGPCGSIGFQWGWGQGLHPYLGSGVGTSGIGLNVFSYPDQTIAEGVNCSVTGGVTVGGVGIGGEVGVNYEGGIFGGGPYFGNTGVALICNHVFPSIY